MMFWLLYVTYLAACAGLVVWFGFVGAMFVIFYTVFALIIFMVLEA